MVEAHAAGTAERILDVAERLVQVRGYNGFSYADVAAELGVTKPSLHYHFASKAALGEALITRYTERFAAALDAIEQHDADAMRRLRSYVDLYQGVLDQERMCLCGMLAADLATLPAEMRAAVVRFFDLSETWLERVLEEGVVSGMMTCDGSPRERAQLILSALEGAMLLARSYREPSRFRVAAARLLSSLSASAVTASRRGTKL